MSKTIKLFNGRANEMQDAELVHSGIEWVATFADGHFWKYPFTENMDLLRAVIAAHNKHNKPTVTAEMVEAQQAKSEALLETL